MGFSGAPPLNRSLTFPAVARLKMPHDWRGTVSFFSQAAHDLHFEQKDIFFAQNHIDFILDC